MANMTKYQAIRTAVYWWSNKINMPEPHDNGDNSSASVFACLFADMKVKQCTESQLMEFRSTLARLIERQIDREMEIDYSKTIRIFLSCDYHPYAMLFDAAQQAGISKSNFPFKTYMLIETNDCGKYFHIKVSDGYGRPYVELDPVNEEK